MRPPAATFFYREIARQIRMVVAIADYVVNFS